VCEQRSYDPSLLICYIVVIFTDVVVTEFVDVVQSVMKYTRFVHQCAHKDCVYLRLVDSVVDVEIFM
jgi:hypothetical protein